MKKTFAVFTVFSLLFLISCKKADVSSASQNPPEAIAVIPLSAVPQVVQTSFANNFSGSTEVEWHKSSNLFQADFNRSNQRHSASFDDHGVETEHHVT